MEPGQSPEFRLKENLLAHLNEMGYYPTISEVKIWPSGECVLVRWWIKTTSPGMDDRIRAAIMDYLMARFPGWSYDVNFN